MGLFDGLLGNATEANHEEVKQELASVLIPEEKINLAFKLVRDLVVFTDYRLIVVDKQGFTGTKHFLIKASRVLVSRRLVILIWMRN